MGPDRWPQISRIFAAAQPGDRLVAINGRRLRDMWDYGAFMSSVSVGEERTWLFARSDRQFSITAAPQRRQFVPALLSLPFNAGLLASLIVAMLVMYRRHEDRVARLGALLLAATACVFRPPDAIGLAGTWRHLPVVAGALLWPACVSSFAFGAIAFSFFAVFLRPIIHRRWSWIAVLTPGAVATAWVALHLLLTVYAPERVLDLPHPDWFTTFFFLCVLGYLAAGIAALIWNYHRVTDLNDRRRVRVLLFGIVVTSIGVLNALVPLAIRIVGLRSGLLVLFSVPAFVITATLVVALPCSLAYAILAQRLFDIRIVVRQGLQYAFARRSILLLVPAVAAVLVVDLAVHADRPLTEIFQARGGAYATLAALAAVVYWKRDEWMTSLDRRFFRDRYDAHQILRQVVEDVRTAAGIDAVAPMVVSRLSEAFHSRFVALVAFEPHQHDCHVLAVTPATEYVPRLTRDSQLLGLARVLRKPVSVSSSADPFDERPAVGALVHASGVDLVAPIATGAGHEREALLVLGAKQSDEPYDRDDRGLLTSVAASLAVLLERRQDRSETDDAFAECPQCGACERVTTTRCAEDGTRLVRVSIPRVLGGRYAIQRRLGRGGMGTVYEALDSGLERRVAVKVIRDEIVGKPEAADRFRHEALVAASFAHPNVVTVYDFGITDNSRGYLVMERLHGATVREALTREGRFAPPRVLHVMGGVCRAVDAAHRRGLVHRDLKPDNIFLTKDEIPKVLDFGIAKSVQPAPDSIALTATGALVGTPWYMAPEQIVGGAPHPSWDVWALAVVAYEMLAGEHPFAQTLPAGWADSMAHGSSRRLTSRQPEVPSQLDAVFAGAFSPDPVERPSGALALMESLERALAG
jgi:serine/threonine-protein kinase